MTSEPLRGGTGSPSRPNSSGLRWPWWVLGACLVVPGYILAVSVVIRSGLFDFASKKPLTANDAQAIWVFLGSAVAASVTACGLLLTNAHNARLILFQREIDLRDRVAAETADRRLTLDTAVATLELLSEGPAYAPKGSVAGALTTLVHLGHPIIAMRCLAASWDDKAIDSASATWLISEAYSKGTPASQIEAANLLRDHALDLTDPTRPGTFSWPN
jgi:hypothetical protein